MSFTFGVSWYNAVWNYLPFTSQATQHDIFASTLLRGLQLKKCSEDAHTQSALTSVLMLSFLCAVENARVSWKCSEWHTDNQKQLLTFMTCLIQIYRPVHVRNSCRYLIKKKNTHFWYKRFTRSVFICFPWFSEQIRIFINGIYQMIFVTEEQCFLCEEDLNILVLLRGISGLK